MEGAHNDGWCHEQRPEFDEFDVPEAALLPKLLIFMNDRGYYKNDVMPVVADVWRAVDPNVVDEIPAVELHSHAQPVRTQRGLYSPETLRESVEGSSTQSVAVLVQSPVLSCHYACVVFESRTNRGFIFDPLHRAAMIADASAVLRALFELMRCTGYLHAHTATRMPLLDVSDQHLCVYAALAVANLALQAIIEEKRELDCNLANGLDASAVRLFAYRLADDLAKACDSVAQPQSKLQVAQPTAAYQKTGVQIVLVTHSQVAFLFVFLAVTRRRRSRELANLGVSDADATASGSLCWGPLCRLMFCCICLYSSATQA
jgi:hypothetical protein